MEENKKQTFIEKNQIEECERNFQTFMNIPKIIAIIYGIFIFIIGIIIMSEEEIEEGLVTWIIGGGIVFLTYWIMKIFISHKILHIAYLREIRDSIKKENN